MIIYKHKTKKHDRMSGVVNKRSMVEWVEYTKKHGKMRVVEYTKNGRMRVRK